MGLPFPSLRNVAATGQTLVMIVRFLVKGAAGRKGRNFVVAQGGFQEITNSRSLARKQCWIFLSGLTVPSVTPIHYVACADRRYRYLQSRHRASKHPRAERVGESENHMPVRFNGGLEESYCVAVAFSVKGKDYKGNELQYQKAIFEMSNLPNISEHYMYGGFPFRALSPRYPMPQERERGGEGERQSCGDGGNQQRFAGRSVAPHFVNERTNTAIKSSSIRRRNCQNFGQRRAAERPSLLPPACSPGQV